MRLLFRTPPLYYEHEEVDLLFIKHMAIALTSLLQLQLPVQDWACQHFIMDMGGAHGTSLRDY